MPGDNEFRGDETPARLQGAGSEADSSGTETRGRSGVGRAVLLLAVDALVIVFSVLGALVLRFEWSVPSRHLSAFPLVALVTIAAGLAALTAFGSHRVNLNFVGLRDIARVATAVAAATLALAAFLYVVNALGALQGFPRSIALIQAPLAFVGLSAVRLLKRMARRPRGRREAGEVTLIVGAGDTGAQILKSIQETDATPAYEVIGFVDDDPRARHTLIHGVPVLGSMKDLAFIVRERDVRVVIICIAHAERSLLQRVVAACRKEGVRTVRLVPPVQELVDGKVNVQATREVRLEDLLARAQVRIDPEDLRGLIQGSRILVTGGAGTIGSELCRQVARLRPERLIVLDVDETRLHDLTQEIAAEPGSPRVEPALVDIRDKVGLHDLFETHRFNVVFHAAAYKHVPMMERWPLSALEVNVVGTTNVAEAAEAFGCERFVLISTDKAVKPTSVLGASKRLAEIALFSGERNVRGTAKPMIRSVVRFGNVIGSRGSVIPTFERQIARGGPLTVTHPEVQRYFMMTSEAVALVLQAAALGEGGDVFVLDMGRPVRILNVAREFIRLHGLEPHVDVPIVFTGLRAGEKLNEDLFYPEERLNTTKHSRILRARATPDPNSRLLVLSVRGIVDAHDAKGAMRLLQARFPVLRGRPMTVPDPPVPTPGAGDPEGEPIPIRKSAGAIP